MVEIGKTDGKKTIAVITAMCQPWVFVATALKLSKRLKLKRVRTKGFYKLSLRLASYMFLCEKGGKHEEGYLLGWRHF